MNFISWIANIEKKELEKRIDNLNFYFENSETENSDVKKEIKKYLNYNKDQIHNEIKRLESIENSENKFTELKKEILLEIESKSIEELENLFLFKRKVRYHKMLYFLNGLYIYYKNFLNFEEEENFLKLNNEQLEWCAFERGPILKNIYHYSKKDDNIEINFNDIKNKELKNILEVGYQVLNVFSTQKLIDESHETAPWKKNWNNKDYYKKISNKDIEEYFKNNRPFFIKF